MANRPENDPKRISWFLILVCLFVAWPLGLILLVIRLLQESGGLNTPENRARLQRLRQEARRGAEEARRAAREAAAWAKGSEAEMERPDQTVNENVNQEKFNTVRKPNPSAASRPAKPERPAAQSRPAASTGASASKEGKLPLPLRLTNGWQNGKYASILGGALTGCVGFATVMSFIENLSYLSFEPMWLVEDVVPLLLTTCASAGLFFWGRFRRKQTKCFRRYLNLIGEEKEVPVSLLAQAYPARPETVRSQLKTMIESGLLGKRAYLDYGRDVLVLSGAGVKAPAQEAPQEKKVAPETAIGEENALLRQIREVNAAIRHPELSRKIDRIGEITERILEFQQEHPDKSAELRKFLNYYLPTTLRILNSYAELEKQGIEGENIAATKKRIEDMMDMVVEGFERQLDKLFAGDMMDIAADITVMEQMMQGDGLFDGQGEGLGGH